MTEPDAHRCDSNRSRVGTPLPLVADVEAVEFEERVILVSERRRALLLLNESARIVWETMRAGVGADGVAALLARGYGVPLPTARADIEALLARWRAEGLLDPAPEPSDPPHREHAGAGPQPRSRAHPQFCLRHVYSLCGTAFCLRFDDEGIGLALHHLLAYAETPGADARHVLDLIQDGAGYRLVHNGTERARDTSAEAALGSVVRAICDLSYPGADWLLFMHAAAVANGDDGVVLIGPNGSGKSTLTAALIHSGLDYLSDDVVPLDGRTMRIVPLPFAISVKEGSWPLLAGLYPALPSLPVYESGGRRLRYLAPPRGQRGPQHRGATVKALVFPRVQLGRPTALYRVPPLQALVRLADGRSVIALERQRLRRTLGWLRTVPAYELVHHDLGEATGAILRLLNS